MRADPSSVATERNREPRVIEIEESLQGVRRGRSPGGDRVARQRTHRGRVNHPTRKTETETQPTDGGEVPRPETTE